MNIILSFGQSPARHLDIDIAESETRKVSPPRDAEIKKEIPTQAVNYSNRQDNEVDNPQE